MYYSNHFFKIASLLFCLLFAAVQFVTAQESEPVSEDLTKSWALQFQINDNFSLSSFQGSTISAKYHFSQKRAIRFGISAFGKCVNQDHDRKRTGSNESNQENFSLSITSQYIFSLPAVKKMRLYFGFGPTAGIFYDWTENKDSNSKMTRERIQWDVGIFSVFGIEWLIRENVGLLAEYGTYFRYNSAKAENISKQKVMEENGYEIMDKFVDKTKSYNFSPLSVKFGLSVYF